MLSETERKQEWARFVDALSGQLGIEIHLDIEVKRLQGPDGVVYQSVPVMRVVAVAGWPEPPTEKDLTQRGKDAKGQSEIVETPAVAAPTPAEDETPPPAPPRIQGGEQNESPVGEGQ